MSRLLLVAVLGVACGDTTTKVIVPPPAGPAPVAVTVSGGSGSGSYLPGTVVSIAADPPAPGMAFDRWTGDVAAVADARRAATELTVPPGGAAVASAYAALPPPPPTGKVTASVETEPVPSSGDAADDMCIWIHPTDPALSTIIGTDKSGGYLLVYGLDGKELHRVDTGQVNNVDLRYNFPLGGGDVTLVTATDRTNDTIVASRVDESTRGLVAVGQVGAGITVYGHCLYVSPVTGETYAFVSSKTGEIEQWQLADDGGGNVQGTRVRTFDVGGQVEGCVADDELGRFYAAEEAEGIWRYDAEPGGGTARTRVDATGSGGHLTADVEGLAIYYARNGAGYLLASSQGASEFVVYERGGANAYVLTFAIEAGVVDGVSNTDGIDVTNAALGPAFPSGLFVAQDGADSPRQNFKLVPWERIAGRASPALLVDTVFDPRAIGR